MLEVFLAAAVLVLLAVAWSQRGKWRERARAAEMRNDTDRKAHEIQNRVAADPAYRERVRRHFDSP